MGKFIDLTGQKFNRLTVIERIGKVGAEWVWHCKCDCGNECDVKGVNIRTGRTKSCGCYKVESDHAPKGNTIDLTGQKFGHLTVIERYDSDGRGEARWLCQCDCPNASTIIVLSSNLRNGHTTSCGCERASHGEQKVAQLLLEKNIQFETQKVLFNYPNGHIAPFDFFVDGKYLIEYDGETHDIGYANKHGWCTEESIKRQLERDAIKNQWCIENKMPLIRIPYTHLKDLCIEDLLLETSSFIVKGTIDEN